MKKFSIAVLPLVALISTTISAQAQNLSAEELTRRSVERRAVEAAIWGMPIVNYDLMLQEMLTKADGKVNQVVYFGGARSIGITRRSPPTPTRFISWLSSTRKMGPSCSNFRRRLRRDRSTVISSTSGRHLLRTQACSVPTRVPAENI